MAKKLIPQATLPVGAVVLRKQDAAPVPFVRRTGAEQFQKIAADVWAYWPANANSKAEPKEGPFVGTCRESGREFVYYSHMAPDRDGVFIPKALDLHPETAAERTDERTAKEAALPDALKDMIEAHRLNLRNGRA